LACGTKGECVSAGLEEGFPKNGKPSSFSKKRFDKLTEKNFFYLIDKNAQKI